MKSFHFPATITTRTITFSIFMTFSEYIQFEKEIKRHRKIAHVDQ